MGILYIETNPNNIRRDLEWTLYADNKNLTEMWKDYIHNYKDLTIVAPIKKDICDKGQKDLIKMGNIYDLEKQHIKLERFEDLFEKRSNLFDKTLRQSIQFLMHREIGNSKYELVVIGSDNNFYQKYAIKLAKKYNKKYEIIKTKICI